MYLGAHLTVSPSLGETERLMEELGCTCVQIFAQNPRSWESTFKPEAEISQFVEYLNRPPVKPLFLHGQYLINLSSLNEKIRKRSESAVLEGVRRAEVLRTENQLFHPGSFRGFGREKGLALIALHLGNILSRMSDKCSLILENGAGLNSFGSRFSDFLFVLRELGQDKRLKICLDTCHAFAAGYEFAEPEGFKRTIGELSELGLLPLIEVFHVNDSKGKLGSGVDRHTHIGEGRIGIKGFKNLMQSLDFSSKCFIIETPKDTPGADLKNLEILRRIVLN